MDREELWAACRRVADTAATSDRLVVGRGSAADLVLEIVRSFRRADISESEKNALLSLVCDPEDQGDVCAESACILDPWADEHDLGVDED